MMHMMGRIHKIERKFNAKAERLAYRHPVWSVFNGVCRNADICAGGCLHRNGVDCISNGISIRIE